MGQTRPGAYERRTRVLIIILLVLLVLGIIWTRASSRYLPNPQLKV